MDGHETQSYDGKEESMCCVSNQFNHNSDYKKISEAQHNYDKEKKNSDQKAPRIEHTIEADKMKLVSLDDISNESSCVPNDLAKQLANREEQLAQSKATIEFMQKQLNEVEMNGTKVNKMKMLAVKLKKDLASANEELAKVQQSEKEAKEQLKSINKEYEKISLLYQQAIRNFQTLQAEYDRLQDEFDQYKVNAKSVNSSFTSSVAQLSKVKEEYAEKIMENDMLNAKINGLKEMIAEYEKKNQNLEGELIIARSDLEKEKKEATDGIKLEKTILELQYQLDIKIDLIAELESKVRESEKIISDYYVLKPEHDKLMTEKEVFSKEICELKEKILGYEKKVESLSFELAEEKTKCCQLSSEKSNLLGKCKLLEEQYSRKIKLLEEKIYQLDESIGQADEELKRKDDEFESYKVRVTKLLNQNKVDSKENEEVKRLKLKLDKVCSEKSAVEERLKQALSEKIQMEEQIKEKTIEKEELILQVAKNSSLSKENQKLLDKIEDLEKCLLEEKKSCEKRLEELNEKHRLKSGTLEQEISALKSHISSFEEEIDSLQQLNHSLMSSTDAQRVSSSPSLTSTPTELPQISPLLKSSECTDKTDYESDSCSQAETSRQTPLSSFSSSKSPAVPNPLMEILNSRDENEEELITYIKQIGDLTQILKESESNNALLTEQNRVLKEEIRRLQRSIERVEIAQNLEYLKNVLVKFVSSEAGRPQLVPVLTTILKLSKQEEEIFSNFATLATNQTSPNSTSSNQTNNWSNYLWQSFS